MAVGVSCGERERVVNKSMPGHCSPLALSQLHCIDPENCQPAFSRLSARYLLRKQVRYKQTVRMLVVSPVTRRC